MVKKDTDPISANVNTFDLFMTPLRLKGCSTNRQLQYARTREAAESDNNKGTPGSSSLMWRANANKM
jgi:hypothetical protein